MDDDVELARRAFELWNADYFHAARELWDENVVMVHPEGWPERGPSRGRDAMFKQLYDDALRSIAGE